MNISELLHTDLDLDEIEALIDAMIEEHRIQRGTVQSLRDLGQQLDDRQLDRLLRKEYGIPKYKVSRNPDPDKVKQIQSYNLDRARRKVK
jgi:hypothetical protein